MASLALSFSAVSRDLRLAPQARGIEQAHLAPRPLEIARHAVARQARLGSGDHAVFAEERVDQRRLAGVRPPDDGDADRPCRRPRLLGLLVRLVHGLQPERRQHLGLEIAQALAVLGGDGDRLAEAELERRVETFLAGAPLALVGDEHDGASRRAHQFAKRFVVRSHAFARVDDEQHEIGGGERRFALLAHALGDRAALGLLEPSRIDDRHRIAGKVGFALAPVARQPRHVGDERRALPVSRLNSVDLPTLGRPMMAMTGGVDMEDRPGAISWSGAYRAFAARMIETPPDRTG